MVHSAFPGSAVVRCPRCDLTYLFPVRSPEELRDAYEGPYFQAYRQAGRSLPCEHEEVPVRVRVRLQRAHAGRTPGRLLEIGVGHGSFLNYARQEGWDVCGLDVSAYVVQTARERFGLEVLHGTLRDVQLASDSFDVVHLSHVVEHLPDPLEALHEVRRVLKPDGVLLVEVPNEFRNLHVRLRELAGVPLAPYPVSSTHLYFFSPRTLTAVLEKSGYRVVLLRTLRDTDDAVWTRSMLKRVAHVAERVTEMGPLIESLAVKV